jgi:hypothetical protein
MRKTTSTASVPAIAIPMRATVGSTSPISQ